MTSWFKNAMRAIESNNREAADELEQNKTTQTMFRRVLSHSLWPSTSRSISTPVKSLILVPRCIVEVCICVCRVRVSAFADSVCAFRFSLAQRHDLARSITTRIERSRTTDHKNILLVTGEIRACECGSWQKQRAREADMRFLFFGRVTRALSAFGRVVDVLRTLVVCGWLAAYAISRAR